MRELIGRVFRTGECLPAAGRLLGQAFLHRSREPLRESDRHQRVADRITSLLDDLGEPHGGSAD
ncbi:hypothetical protein [Streptomyces sp. NPDC091217]|uniref:hypothetical protein n=1 Tax=Streptomyces sp. NPDC091217 TaxID=3365975 RepID=UPI003809E77D